MTWFSCSCQRAGRRKNWRWTFFNKSIRRCFWAESVSSPLKEATRGRGSRPKNCLEGMQSVGKINKATVLLPGKRKTQAGKGLPVGVHHDDLREKNHWPPYHPRRLFTQGDRPGALALAEIVAGEAQKVMRF